MKEKYFRIRDKPDVNGVVVRQTRKGLELFVGKGVSIESIPKEEALRLKGEAEDWELQRGYIEDYI